MPEYQNIMTRMLGADSFPYRNITITDQVFRQATVALDSFFFIGLQDSYDLSVQVLVRELGLEDSLKLQPIKKERDQSNPVLDKSKKAIKENESLMARAQEVNHYDAMLYQLAVKSFCSKIKKYPDLLEKLHATTKVVCR